MKMSHYFAKTCLSAVLLFLVSFGAWSQRRAMNLEDIMNFHHMQPPVISHDGRWVAWSASPDRGDGYGTVVSAGGNREYIIERGSNPRFSHTGNHVLFTRRPSFSTSVENGGKGEEKDAAVLFSTADGTKSVFESVREASFSTTGGHLFIHLHQEKDTTINGSSKKNNNSGTTLLIKDLAAGNQRKIPYVDRFTADSLATVLVFSVKDTLKANNGLFYIPLRNISSPLMAIDTAANMEYGSFSWFQKESRLAWTRSYIDDKDSLETAIIQSWQPGSSGPDTFLTQEDAPGGFFLPFNNSLTWSHDGGRLFFGFRPRRYSPVFNEKNTWKTDLDSIAGQANVHVWHGNDPFIKTHERNRWNQAVNQNFLSVFHIGQRRTVQLADEELTEVQPSQNGRYVLAWTFIPHGKRITWEGSFRDLYVINVETGERTPVARDVSDMASLSPAGEYVLYFRHGHWHYFNTATGMTNNLTGGLDVSFFNENHDTPALPSSYQMAGWLEGGHSVLLYDRYDIWRAGLDNGEMVNITAGEGRSNKTVLRIRKLNDRPLFARGEQLYIEGFNENTKTRALFSARPDRSGLNLLRDEGMNLRFRLLSGDEKTVVYSRESYNEFPDLWLTGTRFRDPGRISRLSEQIEQFNWGTAGLISYTSAHGVPLQGVVIKPGDYDPSKRYPVVVYFYEKFSQRLHDFNQTVINHRPSFGYYASNGYVIFLPDIDFRQGRPGMSAVNSLVPAVKKLIDLGIADPAAIGLHGHSWSGYQAAFVATQTDVFRAIIAGAPVSNMTSAYGGIRWGSGLARQFQYETGQSRLGSSIFDRRYLYIENSPIFYADQINTPMLIMHGDADEAVPWEQSIELYLAMRRAGKDIIFLQYSDEPHHLQKYPNKLDYTIRMKEYFDYHLKGYEPAGWITQGVPFRGR
jgi:dipeptidyl aminopeptidase/acylaminoacyl peptidase